MNHQTRVYENIFETLPSEENPTPLVRINKLNPCAEFLLYAKLEWVNPVWSKNSCGLPVVEFKQPSQALACADLA
jgi:cysteine synthase